MTNLADKNITFTPLLDEQENMVLEWLHEPHVSEWFHGTGLQNTIDGIKAFIANNKQFDAWIAYYDGVPFSFLMTFDVKREDRHHSDCYFSKWIDSEKKSITLDLLIGEENYLGRGLAPSLIHEFITQIYPDVNMVFIDPECSNTKAIHVYEKAEFEKLETFIADWHPVPHVLMYMRKNLKSES